MRCGELLQQSLLERNDEQYALKLRLAQGRELGLPLDERQLRKLALLLDRIQQQAGWGLETPPARQGAETVTGARTLH